MKTLYRKWSEKWDVQEITQAYHCPTKSRLHLDSHFYNTLRLEEHRQSEIQESAKRTIGIFVGFILFL